jgi:hypothetical protein
MIFSGLLRKKIYVIFLYLLFFNIHIAFAAPYNTFAPSSCAVLDSTDLSTHLGSQVDDRINGLTANSSTKSRWDTRGNASGGWDYNEDVWTNYIEPIDWSGLSPFNSSGGYNKGGALITPKHLVFANHYQFAIGDTITFIDGDDNVANRTITKKQRVGTSDAMVAELDSEVPGTITHYPVIDDFTFKEHIDISVEIPLIVFNKTDEVLIRKIQETYRFFSEGLDHFLPIDLDRLSFYEGLSGGDSGDAGFIIINNKPVLMLTHYTRTRGPYYGYYYDDINTILDNWGSEYGISTYDLSCFDVVPNSNPVIAEHDVFSVEEGASVGTSVFTVEASDADGDPLTYSIDSGNTDNAFVFDGNVLKVNNPDGIDFESSSQMELVVRVTDISSGFSTSTYTIDVVDVDEDIIFDNQSFTIAENPEVGDVVGTISYTPADTIVESEHVFSFTSNSDDNFEISSSGVLTIKDLDAFDYESNTSVSVSIRLMQITPNDSVLDEKIRTITVNITDIDNESAPNAQIDNSNIAISENYNDTETVLATVSATDPEEDVLIYYISNGDVDNIFSVDIDSGEITVANPSNIDYETNTSYTLTVTVREFSTDELYTDNVTLSVEILNVNDENITINFSAGTGGTIEGSTTQNIFEGEDLSEVTAVADRGYVFVNWSGDHSSEENPLLLNNVLESKNIIANFQQFNSASGGSSGSSKERNIDKLISEPGVNKTISETFSSLSNSDKILINDFVYRMFSAGVITKTTADFILNLAGVDMVQDRCPVLIDSDYVFLRNLRTGFTGEDVRQLQIILNNNGFVISNDGPGSIGNETTYFGELTRRALIDFQNACSEFILYPIGLDKGNGFFGPATLKFINGR